MPVTRIPRFFPCLRRPEFPVFQSEFIHLDSPVTGGCRALVMHSTRQAAQIFIDLAGKNRDGWKVGYIGYDVMLMWLIEAAGLYAIDSVVVDKLAPDIEPTLVLPLERMLIALNECDENADEIPIEGELYAI